MLVFTQTVLFSLFKIQNSSNSGYSEKSDEAPLHESRPTTLLSNGDLAKRHHNFSNVNTVEDSKEFDPLQQKQLQQLKQLQIQVRLAVVTTLCPR